jgi:hypothetical protein
MELDVQAGYYTLLKRGLPQASIWLLRGAALARTPPNGSRQDSAKLEHY